LTVKGALVKSVCYVTEQIIFDCILQLNVEHMDQKYNKTGILIIIIITT